ncbi:hypothetical protein CUC15_05880 [Oceanobacillus zhaokaii]|uniref:Alpha/beta hydrolase n=1 Tax=Oceanobacillus zhaokaii TaxID=2052660 RepID=A0A345PEP4_9BACI|nr:alpha/beta hydrolase [Oceanobacillus zhaokaii]AXI08474.1 hypothetical protein CUC15_05880 [Oceanobacillus zhaokaii]
MKRKIEKPFLLVLAENSMDEFSKDKAEAFKQLQTNLSVVPIPSGYHFLPITNPIQVANTLKKHILAN